MGEKIIFMTKHNELVRVEKSAYLQDPDKIASALGYTAEEFRELFSLPPSPGYTVDPPFPLEIVQKKYQPEMDARLKQWEQLRNLENAKSTLGREQRESDGFYSKA